MPASSAAVGGTAKSALRHFSAKIPRRGRTIALVAVRNQQGPAQITLAAPGSESRRRIAAILPSPRKSWAIILSLRTHHGIGALALASEGLLGNCSATVDCSTGRGMNIGPRLPARGRRGVCRLAFVVWFEALHQLRNPYECHCGTIFTLTNQSGFQDLSFPYSRTTSAEEAAFRRHGFDCRILYVSRKLTCIS